MKSNFLVGFYDFKNKCVKRNDGISCAKYASCSSVRRALEPSRLYWRKVIHVTRKVTNVFLREK